MSAKYFENDPVIGDKILGVEIRNFLYFVKGFK